MRNKRVKRGLHPVNLYGLGSEIKSAWGEVKDAWGDTPTLDKATGGLSLGSGLIDAIGGGTETTGGNILKGIGNVASMIPGVGGIIGAGVGAVGGLVNAAFGTKWNDEFIAQTESNINNQKNLQVDANTNEDLLSEWGDFSTLSNVSTSQVGKDGWFSNKAKRKAKRMNKAIREANQRALTTFEDRAGNIDSRNDLAIAANFASYGGQLFADGGGIHIKKKNRGKFTDYCGGKVTSACIQRGLHSSNPTTRKRANFARNARKWHAFGGELGTNGTDWTNGVNIFDVGGTHEENPNQGIPQGVDENGIPNLVEQDEVRFQDYIYSNRIKADKNALELVGLPTRGKGKTYAKLAERASVESRERPNDPISMRGLTDSMIKLQVAQEMQREEKGQKKYAKGGRLFDDGGFTLKLSAPIDDMGTISSQAKMSTAAATAARTKAAKRANSKGRSTWMRYMPAMGGAFGALAAALTPVDAPNYGDAYSIIRARRSVAFTPLTQKLAYRPFDRDFYTNKLNAQAGATRRALTNASNGNRGTLMAGLIGADYNAQNQMGDLFRQSEEYNQAQRERVTAFNRGTDQVNSQMAMQAAMANAESSLQAAQAAAALRQAEAQRYREDKQARMDAIGANLGDFFASMGAIGKENVAFNQADSLSDAGVYRARTDNEGNIIYTGYGKGGKVRRKKNTTKIKL